MAETARSIRWTAVTLLGLAAIAPAGIWYIYLFATETPGWRASLDYALSPENEIQYLFVLFAVGAVFSAIAAATVALCKRQLVLRMFLGGAIAQTLAYAYVGAWSLVLVSALPLWWLYKVSA
jgi:hypothetical protein